jgi:hypothetical protein
MTERHPPPRQRGGRKWCRPKSLESFTASGASGGALLSYGDTQLTGNATNGSFTGAASLQ